MFLKMVVHQLNISFTSIIFKEKKYFVKNIILKRYISMKMCCNLKNHNNFAKLKYTFVKERDFYIYIYIYVCVCDPKFRYCETLPG